MALPVLLQALALSKEYRLQYLASETVLNLAFSQVSPAPFSLYVPVLQDWYFGKDQLLFVSTGVK